MNICFIGAGYVGLTWAAVLADLDNQVYVVDIDSSKINKLKKGKAPFYEAGLDKLVKNGVNKKNLIPTTDYQPAIENSKIIFIAVGTPLDKQRQADLSQLKAAVKEIAEHLNKDYKLIVNKSTAPPGTLKKIKQIIINQNPQANSDLVFCPEFLRESTAVKDTQHPGRVIIGTNSDRAYMLLKKLYLPLTENVIRTSPESAEIIKYASNAYLALRIGFIDQIASLAEQIGADINQIIKGISEDKRIGGHYWYPGIGYGGYCFPKDVATLSKIFDQAGLKDNLFTKLDQLNRQRPIYYAEQVGAKLNGLRNKKIAVLGLTAKPGTGDMRGSQAIAFIKHLVAKGAKVSAYDPKGMEEAKEIMPDINYAQSAYQAVKNSDAVAILCEWPEFKKLNWKKIKQKMNGRLIFDAKGLLEKDKLIKLGFNYFKVGERDPSISSELHSG